MKIVPDTNILVRAAVQDDPVQGAIARKLMQEAGLLAVTLPALCEFCCVLRKAYDFEPARIAAAIHVLLDAENVALDRSAVEAGLAMLEAGGDFADGVIAHDGRWLGGESFISFDKEAVRLLQDRGEAARVPA